LWIVASEIRLWRQNVALDCGISLYVATMQLSAVSGWSYVRQTSTQSCLAKPQIIGSNSGVALNFSIFVTITTRFL
jgi:ABC-type Fe3+-siderophore transport system permease subunit